ncbi:MAG: rhomboid family intramembrane serine protease, partial [Bdellovibrionales bacterium]
TKMFVGLFLVIHLGLWAVSQMSDDNMLFWASAHWGFLPARFTGEAGFLPYTVLTPLTYALFHGGWAHVLMNTVMLAAFGAGFEKMLGLKNLMIVFWGSTVIAAGVHFSLDPYSMIPMVGASGGISGLFAGLILVMNKSGRLAPNRKIMPVILIFVAISLVFGLLGGSDGSIIAWAAHIGGFLGGLLITHIILKKG